MIISIHIMVRNQNTKQYLVIVITATHTTEPMKEPHSTLSEMPTVIKCTNHEHELKKHRKAQVDGTTASGTT